MTSCYCLRSPFCHAGCVSSVQLRFRDLWRRACRLEVATSGSAHVHECAEPSHRVRDLQPATHYDVRVASVAACGHSAFSASATLSTTLPPPEAPGNLTVEVQHPAFAPSRKRAKPGACLALTWTHGAAARPQVYQIQALAASGHKLAAEARACAAVLRGAEHGARYEVRVRALGDATCGHSPWSDSVAVTTPAASRAATRPPSEAGSETSSLGALAPSPRSGSFTALPALAAPETASLPPLPKPHPAAAAHRAPLSARSRGKSRVLPESSVAAPCSTVSSGGSAPSTPRLTASARAAAASAPTARAVPSSRRKKLARELRRRCGQYTGIALMAALFLLALAAFALDVASGRRRR